MVNLYSLSELLENCLKTANQWLIETWNKLFEDPEQLVRDGIIDNELLKQRLLPNAGKEVIQKFKEELKTYFSKKHGFSHWNIDQIDEIVV
jgi:hypothetical protein